MCTGTGDVRDLISSWGGEMTQYHMQQGNSQDMWLFALLAVSALATSNASVKVINKRVYMNPKENHQIANHGQDLLEEQL